jgi:hypothetical protein
MIHINGGRQSLQPRRLMGVDWQAAGTYMVAAPARPASVAAVSIVLIN